MKTSALLTTLALLIAGPAAASDRGPERGARDAVARTTPDRPPEPPHGSRPDAPRAETAIATHPHAHPDADAAAAEHAQHGGATCGCASDGTHS